MITQKQEILPFVTVGPSSVFTLSLEPLDPTAVMMFVNGIKIPYGEYVVGGSNNQTVTYTPSGFPIPPLLPTDTCEFWFIVL